MMTKRRLFALALVTLPGAALTALDAGCSLVNSFSDVVAGPADGAAPGTDAKPADDHSAPPAGDDGGGNDATQTKDTGAGSDAFADAPATIPDGGTDAADAGPTGVIVVAGNTASDGGFVLTSIDPTTGLELNAAKRESMVVVSVHYDGLRDLWYIFENTGIGQLFPAPNDPVFLHVRQLDAHSGAWTELAKLAVPAIVSNDSVAILNQRLVYTAYALNDAGVFSGGYELVLVNTSTPSAPTLVAPPTPLASQPTGMIGTRNPSGAGGTLNLFSIDKTQCQGDGSAQQCELEALHYTVPANDTPQPAPQPVGIGAVNPQGSEGVASYLNGGPEDIVAFPPLNGTNGYVELFSSSASVPVAGSTRSFGISNVHLQNLAVSECYGMAFVLGVPLDTFLYGVSLTGATTTVPTANMGHAGQGVAFEPYTSSVITPFKANGSSALNAFSLTGTLAAPALGNRANDGTWTPPGDLAPNFVAVREPIPFTGCGGIH